MSPSIEATETAPHQPSAARFLPLLLVLFIGSGCAALMYEIVWYQMLQLAIGSTSISIGFLLATFMGGLCIGSIWFPRLKTNLHPLKLYAYIEMGIGICGLLVLWLLPLLDNVYFAITGYGFWDMVLRAALSAIFLLPPTILMGASLPAASRWIQSTAAGASWWGLLYGGNTIGAVLGCLITGFYTLRLYNQSTATYAAVLLNFVVVGVAWWLASMTPDKVEAETETGAVIEHEPDFSRSTILWTIGLSGATALGAEVVWTRLLGYLMGATTYVFSIILAVFLIGIAVGSTVGAWIGRTARPRIALGGCQILLELAIFWTSYTISDSLPYWPVNPFLTPSPWYTFQIDMARTLWTILPPTLLWGASFPLALAAVGSLKEDSARSVGSVYAANTLGSIVGALSASLILVPAIGTQNTQRLMLVLAAVGALTALAPYVKRYNAKGVGALLSGAMMLAVGLAMSVNQVPGEFIAYGRQMPTMLGYHSDVVYVKEGINSSVAISKWPGGQVYLNVNGHVEATTEIFDMALQRMVGHLPGILHPNPKSVLGIGFGAGVSAGTFTRYPGIEKITICEIEPVIPPAATEYFGPQNYEVALNPKTTIVYDDARHFMMTTKEKFDIIASDPLDVFAKGTAALYSREYFTAVKEHLNPGGFFTLYVPLYESDIRTVKGELATFFDVFPNATVWANTRSGQGYDMVFMGQVDRLKINIDDVDERLSQSGYQPVIESLREVGFPSATSLFSTYTGRKSDLGAWCGDADITTDRDLRLMYQAGWGINSYKADSIYRDMLQYSEVPRDLFEGSPDRVNNILSYLERRFYAARKRSQSRGLRRNRR